MAVTEPTRTLYTAAFALWANTPDAGAAESVPNDAAKTKGHEFESIYTSGRGNFIHASVSEWQNMHRLAFFPQHQDAGNHNQIVVDTDAAGEIGLDVESDAGEAAGQVKLRVQTAAGGTAMAVSAGGTLFSNTISTHSGTDLQLNAVNAAATTVTIVNSGAGDPTLDVQGQATIGNTGTDLVKLTTVAPAADAAATKQVRVLDQAAEVFSIQTDGTINTDMPTWNFTVAPAGFHGTLDNAGANDASGVLYETNAVFNLVSAGAQGTAWRGILPENRFVEGDVLTAITLHTSLTNAADTITLTLKGKTAAATKFTVGSATETGAAGAALTESLSGMPYTVLANSSFFWEILLTDNVAPGDIEVQLISGTIQRALIR